MTALEKTLTHLKTLILWVHQLRDPIKGDPWILEQDFRSLVSLTLEEAYEFAESAEQQDYVAMRDELGDLLLHVLLYAHLGDEAGRFDLADIAEKALLKQQRRRIHFKNPGEMSAAEALKQWEAQKQKERETQSSQAFVSALDGISRALPSLHHAMKLQLQAAQSGFDWPDATPVFTKIQEEIQEVQEVLTEAEHKPDAQKLSEEIGDLLFACVNLARKLEIHPDTALRHANHKFEQRFRQLEQELQQQNKKPEQLTLEELDQIWEALKSRG